MKRRALKTISREANNYYSHEIANFERETSNYSQGGNNSSRPCPPKLTRPSSRRRGLGREITTHVLIDTRARTGSSLLQGLLNLNTDVVSFFEPCDVLPRIDGANKFSLRQFCGEYLSRLLTCRLSRREAKTLIHDMETKRAAAKYCAVPNLSRLGAGNALKGLNESCRVRTPVAKTIRLSGIAEKVLDAPGGRVILLLRDPRAIVNSWRQHGWCKYDGRDNLTACARDICDDFMRKIDLYSKHPRAADKYLMVRYEDFVRAPISFTESLYKWLGFRPPSPYALEWVAANTRGDSGNAYSLSRDAGRAARKWRDQLNDHDQDAITNSCRGLLDWVSYTL